MAERALVAGPGERCGREGTSWDEKRAAPCKVRGKGVGAEVPQPKARRGLGALGGPDAQRLQEWPPALRPSSSPLLLGPVAQLLTDPFFLTSRLLKSRTVHCAEGTASSLPHLPEEGIINPFPEATGGPGPQGREWWYGADNPLPASSLTTTRDSRSRRRDLGPLFLVRACKPGVWERQSSRAGAGGDRGLRLEALRAYRPASSLLAGRKASANCLTSLSLGFPTGGGR